MDAIFDSFENYNSMEVVKESFDFHYSLCQVWEAGTCIYNHYKPGIFTGKLVAGDLLVTLPTDEVNAYVFQEFSFQEVSMGGYYKLWRTSTPILEIPNLEPKTPMYLGMYYLDGELAKINLNIYEPTVLVDFVNDKVIERAKVRFDIDMITMKHY